MPYVGGFPGLLALLLAGSPLAAQERPALGDLSLEELGKLEITTVSKRPERLAQAPAAVYVITSEDIRRSGAVTLAEALRLAPNLQVARVDASQYAIGAGGLNISNVNKMLVLIDGRSVYSVINAGVFWDVQDLPLSKVERIEVIRGPGGALWGSNAVNGVINVITRSSGDSQGGRLTAGGGTGDRFHGNFRFGGRMSEHGAFRVYGKFLDRGPSELQNGASAEDAFRRAQMGFRADWEADRDTLTVQGDAYRVLVGQPGLDDKRLQGGNLLTRWSRQGADASQLTVQAYVDRTRRWQPGAVGALRYTFEGAVDTADLDIQHRFGWGGRHDLIWGGGYRTVRDEDVPNAAFSFRPAHKTLRLFNLFLQDTLGFRQDRLRVTVGAKAEHNDYTGWEFQPSLRLGWAPDPQTLWWAAASRAVRTPSRVDRDFYVNLPGLLVLNGGPAFRSEVLTAYEAGYRAQPFAFASLSLSTFYNQYRHLRTLEVAEGILANRAEAESYGAELWGEAQLAETWRLKPGYAYQRLSFRTLAGSSDAQGPGGVGNDARHRVLLTSLWRPAPAWEVDATLRHVSALPHPVVPAYWALDLHVGWRPRPGLELTLLGRDLLEPRHAEFGPPASQRFFEPSWGLRATWTF